MKRIGYFVSDGKEKRMEFGARLISHAKHYNFEIIKLDLTRSLEEQGPFDLIIHKVSEIYVQSFRDERSKVLFQNFQEYTHSHPEILILNPLTNVDHFINRKLQYELMASFLSKGDQIFIPTFVEVTNTDRQHIKKLIHDSNVQYPIICKPIIAEGFSSCHEFSLIFCDEGLTDIQPPCVVQSFVQHDACLFKCFIIGNHISVVKRPSLKNLQAGNYPTIPFNSHHISKPDSNHYLTMRDEQHVDLDISDGDQCNEIKKLCKSLRQLFNFDLFGVDFIKENGTNRYAIIDVNTFPGYDGVPCFTERLLDYINYKFQLHHQQPKHLNGRSDQSYLADPAHMDAYLKTATQNSLKCSENTAVKNNCDDILNFHSSKVSDFTGKEKITCIEMASGKYSPLNDISMYNHSNDFVQLKPS